MLRHHPRCLCGEGDVWLPLVAGVVGGLYLLEAEPAGLDRTHVAILMAAMVAASLVDDNFLIGCGRLRESAAISAAGGLYVCALAAALATAGPSGWAQALPTREDVAFLRLVAGRALWRVRGEA
jgi:hypothetical protein